MTFPDEVESSALKNQGSAAKFFLIQTQGDYSENDATFAISCDSGGQEYGPKDEVVRKNTVDAICRGTSLHLVDKARISLSIMSSIILLRSQITRG